MTKTMMMMNWMKTTIDRRFPTGQFDRRSPGLLQPSEILTLFESPEMMSASSGTEGYVLTLRWVGDAATGYLKMVDQTLLPTEHVEIDCRDVPSVWEAIKSLRVRGAPAIGVAAAYGAVLGARVARRPRCRSRAPRTRRGNRSSLRTSRPTAVNLFWALDRMDRCLARSASNMMAAALLEQAARRGPKNRRRRSLDVPRDRPIRRSSDPARSWRAHALQRRRAGNRRLRHRPRRDLRRARAGHAPACLCRRDPPALAGRSA